MDTLFCIVLWQVVGLTEFYKRGERKDGKENRKKMGLGNLCPDLIALPQQGRTATQQDKPVHHRAFPPKPSKE